MKIKDKLNIIIFFGIIFGFFITNFLSADNVFSKTERRKLAVLPKTTSIRNFSKNFENYSTDQFFKRDMFRTIKNYTELTFFRKKDVHSLFLYNDSIAKMEKLNEKSVKNAADKMNTIYDKYLKNMNVYYTIVPGKECYIPKEEGYPKYEYNQIEKIVDLNVKNMEKIEIFDKLTFDSYYKTDSHWKQENLFKVANEISQKMTGENLNLNYETKTLEEFYGVYYGQLLYKLKPDTITYLTNDIIENSIVHNFETDSNSKVYDMRKKNAEDKYDIFLSGPTSVLQITNPNMAEDRELIVFRDSFGSSLIPLLIEKYNKITLVDLRYISINLLESFIDFEEKDVLFMISTMLFNNSYSIK